MILKLRLPCHCIQNTEKSRAVDPESKHLVNARKGVAVNTDNITETPAANPLQNLNPCVPLDIVGTTKRWRYEVWAAHVLGIPPPV